MLWDHSFRELIAKGGPLMWLLFATLVVVIALILDRAIAHLWWFQSLKRVCEGLRPLIRRKQWDTALSRCQSSDRHCTHIAETYLRHRESSREERDEILERERTLIMQRFETRLRWLGILGQLSPLIGLLGTVSGLVSAFHQIELVGGQVQPSDLASGIWQALLTTVFGLVIAIPAVASYHFFAGRNDAVARDLTVLVSYLDEWSKYQGNPSEEKKEPKK